MKFIETFFQLLVIGICCLSGFGADTEENDYEYHFKLESVSILGDRNFSSPHLLKYRFNDMFYMYDAEDSYLADAVFDSNVFASSQIKFYWMYGLESSLIFHKQQNRTFSIECKFTEEEHIQKFFHSVNSLTRMDDQLNIETIIRYKQSQDPSVAEIERFTNGAKLSVSSTDETPTVYYITHKPNDKDEQADLVFSSGQFNISSLVDGTKIALSIRHIPNVRFLIKFSDGQSIDSFLQNYYMNASEGNSPIEFPNLTSEQNSTWFNE